MAEQKKRGRKPKTENKELHVSLDTPKVDVEIHKTDEGLTAELDTERVDVRLTKDAERTILEIDIDDKKEYEIIATGADKRLPKGTIWKVTGELLKIFLRKGSAKLKK